MTLCSAAVVPTFMASPFPIHFCSSVRHLLGAPCYTHPDALPFRVLSRLLSPKYLHAEIHEKTVTLHTATEMLYYLYQNQYFRFFKFCHRHSSGT